MKSLETAKTCSLRACLDPSPEPYDIFTSIIQLQPKSRHRHTEAEISREAADKGQVT